MFNKKKLAALQRELDECHVQRNKYQTDLQTLNDRFKGVTDVEEEILSLREELRLMIEKRDKLNSKYKEGKSTYKELKEEIVLYEQKLEMISFGIYEPIFDYEDSESFKSAILENKSKQKQMVKDKTAIICHTEWTVGNSVRAGRTMTNRNMKLMLRAFNNECDSLIAKVKWNNVTNLQERILKSFNAINKLGETNRIDIQKAYCELRVDELKLTHEYQLKKYEEKEGQREIRARIREEEKAQRDYEKAKKEAEIEEKRYQKALDAARKDLGLVSGEELDKLNHKIAQLESNLEEAQNQKERALSMAQQTKAGYVCVISNIGSFGEDIYKIGLTRRLEPLDRVRELGDSSVPFLFDVHALIYSDNAPDLETKLHKKFKDKSVNLINFRKEFFKVTLDEIIDEIKGLVNKKVDFIHLAEAKEYRESTNIRNLRKEMVEPIEEEDRFPEELF